MPLLEIEVVVRQDGNVLDGFPIIRRINPNQVQAQAHTQVPGNAADQLIPGIDYLTTINALLLNPLDGAIVVKLNGAATGFTINAGGVLLLLDGIINAGAATNVKVNDSNSPMGLNVVAAGP